MGLIVNSVFLPLLLMATLVIAQSNNYTTKSNKDAKNSLSISTMTSTSIAPDLVVSGDLSKAARVERMSPESDSPMFNDSELVTNANTSADTNANTTPNERTTPKSTDDQYDVIDVSAATAARVGNRKSGQTTRIYTTGDVNDDFWLKHLGDDFKHAIHLQVGGVTNGEYNRIINQTSGGVHEEVHHEYLPGAERPPEAAYQHQPVNGYGQANSVSQLSLNGESMTSNDNYLRQQHEQSRYAQQQHQHTHSHNYNYVNRPRGMYNTRRHTHPRTHFNTNTNTYSRQCNTQGSNRYKPNHNQAGAPGHTSNIINSSEDILHASRSQATSTSAALSSASVSSMKHDDTNNPLPFKSPFNDYGSRPTRDLTYLIYKRGL